MWVPLTFKSSRSFWCQCAHHKVNYNLKTAGRRAKRDTIWDAATSNFYIYVVPVTLYCLGSFSALPENGIYIY